MTRHKGLQKKRLCDRLRKFPNSTKTPDLTYAKNKPLPGLHFSSRSSGSTNAYSLELPNLPDNDSNTDTSLTPIIAPEGKVVALPTVASENRVPSPWRGTTSWHWRRRLHARVARQRVRLVFLVAVLVQQGLHVNPCSMLATPSRPKGGSPR